MEDQKYRKHGAGQLGGEPDITPAQAGAGIVLVLISQLVCESYDPFKLTLEDTLEVISKVHFYSQCGMGS